MVVDASIPVCVPYGSGQHSLLPSNPGSLPGVALGLTGCVIEAGGGDSFTMGMAEPMELDGGSR